MRQIKAVIFDFGNVVLDLGDFSNTKMVAEVFGVVQEKVKLYLHELLVDFSIGKMNEEEFWQAMAKKLEMGVPETAMGKWATEEALRFVYPEVINLVKELKAQEIVTAVLSNTIAPHADFIRNRGWFDDFDEVFLSNEIGLRKPDKAAYEHVLKKLNLKANEAVFIDDLEENLLPAVELGIQTILAKNPGQTVADVWSILNK